MNKIVYTKCCEVAAQKESPRIKQEKRNETKERKKKIELRLHLGKCVVLFWNRYQNKNTQKVGLVLHTYIQTIIYINIYMYVFIFIYIYLCVAVGMCMWVLVCAKCIINKQKWLTRMQKKVNKLNMRINIHTYICIYKNTNILEKLLRSRNLCGTVLLMLLLLFHIYHIFVASSLSPPTSSRFVNEQRCL